MEKPQVSGFGIHLKVANINKSREFYESLGFQTTFVYGSEEFRSTFDKSIATAPEDYPGITYKIGDATIEISEGHIGVKDKNVFQEVITTPKISAVIHVNTLLPILSNKLVEIKVPVRHYYWGTIEAVFRDPDGFVLVLMVPYSDEEFAKISKLTNIEKITK
ncbi:hypothetical protein HYT24_01365 [Candidatus Pacearchaeota archaeon]|nr:hypothetical protein [Candidatus Pacearchaeota archaeon]